MKEVSVTELLEAGHEAIFTDEIKSEAEGLMATIQEGCDLETIIQELFEYSQSVVAMTMTKFLHTIYTPEQVDEKIEEHRNYLTDSLIGEIENYLEAN